jgi:hypothetical protein
VLVALVWAASAAAAFSVGAERVDLVNENDGGFILAREGKELTDESGCGVMLAGA